MQEFLARALLAAALAHVLALGAPGALRPARGLMVDETARRALACAALILCAPPLLLAWLAGAWAPNWLAPALCGAALPLLRAIWGLKGDLRLAAPRFGPLLRAGRRPLMLALVGALPGALLAALWRADLCWGALAACGLLLVARAADGRDEAAKERYAARLILAAALLTSALTAFAPIGAMLPAWAALAAAWAAGALRLAAGPLLLVLAGGLLGCGPLPLGPLWAAAACACALALARRALYAAYLPLRAWFIRRRAR